MSIEQNQDKEFQEVQKYFDEFIWYYKKTFNWIYLIYNEKMDIIKRITFEGGKENLKNGQVILKLIKIDDKKGFNILKEPYFLACLKNNRYFIEIIDLFPSKDSTDSQNSKAPKFFNIILRNEGSDLNTFISYYNKIFKKDYNILIPNISRFIIFQVVCGLKILHEKGLSHNDIKPQNIIISSTCKVKICDLGSTEINNTVADIGTLGYLSPQAMAGNKRKMEDDMFAVGIVFLELLNREIGIFLKNLPKNSPRKQLLYIIHQFYDISFININYNEATKDNIIYNSIKDGKYNNINFELKEDIFRRNEDEENKKLIKNLLEVDPIKRMKAEDLINDPMFTKLNFKFEKSNTDIKYDKKDYRKYFESTEEFKYDIFKDYIEDIREKFIGKTLFEK